ncbi:MAG TPA: site-2 protease family protein [Erythrobacter sp.]|nr:site-2 protease family protein [Erythrobacter sp.]
MPDIGQSLIILAVLLFSLTVHEMAHALTADWYGDPTARRLGRISLNPAVHVDPVGTIMLPLLGLLAGGFVFGWAKPVPVRGDRLRDPRFGMVAVAAAGPATNLVLAFIGALVFGAVSGTIIASGGTPPDWLLSAGGMFILINVFLALFNLLPIPPFDGSHIVGGLLPPKWAANWQKLQSMGMLFFIILIAATWAFPNSGLIENTVLPPVLWLQERYFEIAEWMARGIAG